MNELYDVLELCLQEIEKGTDVETVLSQYPEYAQELRPILETSVQAIQLATLGPSPEAERRGRARVLQQAAQMREAQVRPSRRIWSVPLRRALVSLAVIGVLFISSTNLVRASSTTLPGDNLYPVKRTWEDVRVLLAFNTQEREALEVEHENERLAELNDLFSKGRSANVDFAGTVTSQNGNLWMVSKIPVLISSQTQLGTQAVTLGNAIRVRGYTQADGTVLAEAVDLLPVGIPLPTVNEDGSLESGQEKSGSGQSVGEDDSAKGSGVEGPSVDATKPARQEAETAEPSKDSSSGGDISSNDGGSNSTEENSNSGSSTGDNHTKDGGGGNDTGGESSGGGTGD
jgi:hypothetical protein